MDALLKNLVDAYSSQNNDVRKAAEKQVLWQISRNFPEMMGLFGKFLSEGQQPDTVKMGVLTFLARIFKDKSEEIQRNWVERVPAKTQQVIRTSLFLGLTNPTLRNMCLTCVVALATLEMPRELWGLCQINDLCELSKRGETIGLRAIGGICQDVIPSAVNPYITRIAETLYAVLTAYTSNPEIIKCVLETIGSSMNALEFVFTNASVRDNLVNTVSALLGCHNEDVIVAAFKTLESFVEHGYFHMSTYLNAIFESTKRILSMKSIDNNRSSAICAALGFWLATADRECDVISDAAKTARGVEAFAPRYYIRAVYKELVPQLLECLTLLDDDDASDLDLSTFEEAADYVPAVAYGCLGRIFACAAAEHYELSSQGFFAALHQTLLASADRLLKSGSWKGVAAGLWIVEVAAPALTPAQLQAMAGTALGNLTAAGAQPLVRALSAQVLGALAEAQPGTMAPAATKVIGALAGPLKACAGGSDDGARLVGLECCAALGKIAEEYCFKNVDDPAQSPLAAAGVFEGVTQACLVVADEEVQPKAYGVVTAFVASEVLPPATAQALVTLAGTLMTTIERAPAGTSDAALEARVACINACISQARIEDDALIRRLLTILNGTFSSNTLPLTQERSLETIAAIVDALEKRFDAYADGIKEGIAALALNTDEPGVAKKAVEVISHMANVNNPKLDSFRYFETKINDFFNTSKSIFKPMQTTEVRSLGAPYISLFSDFANYMEDRFLEKLESVVELFTKFSAVKVDRNDDDYCDFVYGVRLSVSRFFLTVVTKFAVTGKLGDRTQAYISVMMKSVVEMNSDGDPPAELGASALTIVTNLARASRTNFRALFNENVVKVASITNMVLQVYTDARDANDSKTVSIANDAVIALREAGIQLQ